MPKGWMPTKRHRDTSCTLQQDTEGEGKAGILEGTSRRWSRHSIQKRAQLQHGGSLALPPPSLNCRYLAQHVGCVPSTSKRVPSPACSARSACSPLQVVQREFVVEQLGEAQQLAHRHILARPAGAGRQGRVGRRAGSGRTVWTGVPAPSAPVRPPTTCLHRMPAHCPRCPHCQTHITPSPHPPTHSPPHPWAHRMRCMKR